MSAQAAESATHVDGRSVEEPPVADRAEAAIGRIAALLAGGELVAVGYSGGKDSSVVLGLALQAWQRVRAGGTRPHQLLVVSGDTGIENPVVQRVLEENHAMLADYASAQGVDIETEMARPNLAERYLVQLISGRALPTWTNTPHRSCSVSLKVVPGSRTIRLAAQRLLGAVAKSRPPVVLVGSRVAESAARARNMTARGLSDGRKSASGHGTRTVAPIADWSSDDVWEWLACAGADAAPPFTAWRENFDEIVELYRDASGECPVVMGDRGPRSACGARHGCALCTASGARDASLETMLEHPKHRHLQGLNDLRNWLAASQHRWDLRAGLTRKRADDRETLFAGVGTYRPEVCADLLRMCLSLDVLERDRAAGFAARQDAGYPGDVYLSALELDGKPEDTAYARRMRDPQFRLIDLEALIAIDYYWSLNGMHPPFEALRIYRDVCRERRLMAVPALDPGDPDARPGSAEIPAPGLWDRDGLRDHSAETVMPETHHPRRQGRVWVMPYEEARSLAVDTEAATLWILTDLDGLIADHEGLKPFAAAVFYLRNRIVAPIQGRAGMISDIAQRGQWVSERGGWS